MKILVAPDKFKGSLTAAEVCQAIEQGLLRTRQKLQIQKIPLADGGEGSVDILRQHLNLQQISLPVKDPLGRTIEAGYMISPTAAYIEMARASGLDLLAAGERNCLFTTSYGTGQMILDACGRGISSVFLFVGGSATNDGGIGVLDALGIHAMGAQGLLPAIGKSLPEIIGFAEDHPGIGELDITVVCDVENPLYGEHGAAFVYAPQKGADAAAVKLLDRGLRNLAGVIRRTRGKRVDNFKGAGAAGGIAAGLKAFFNVKIMSGIETIMQMVELPEALSTADLVITGEGKFDRQTLQGKVVKGVYDLCTRTDKKLAVICGVLELEPEIQRSLGIWKVMPLVRADTTLEQARNNAFELVSQRAFELLDL